MMAGKMTIDRRNMVKRGDRIRLLKSKRKDKKNKTFKATIKV
jgi:hypothetical protein